MPLSHLKLLPLVLSLCACHAQPTEAPPARREAATSSSTAVGASELAGAFGLGPGRPLPKGLVPGGDCPSIGAAAADEIAAQASAPVPLKGGLTLAYSWMRSPGEEYECLIQVQSVDDDGVNTTLSCNGTQHDTPLSRRICRADLRDARFLHTAFGVVKVLDVNGVELPETIAGATAFSISSAAFARLKAAGSVSHHYVELSQGGGLAKDGVGELHLDRRATMALLVNDRPLEVPVVYARGGLKWWIRGQILETSESVVILDNDRFPLLIDQQSSAEGTGSRIQFVKISYPHESASPIEGELSENRPVDVYGIYFDFNSDRIRAESAPVLKEIAEVLQRHPDWKLGIEGHTDSIGGNTDYNLQLSQRRSEAVRTALASQFGIAAERLSASGRGAASPKDTNDTAAGRARNRRVELVRR